MCKANKIEDFGQKIGGARKDYAAQTIELAAALSGVTIEQLQQLTLSKVVKFEQVQRLAAAGAISAPAACAAWALWRTIKTKPSMSTRVGRWAKETAAILAEISAVIGGSEITDRVKRLPEYRVLRAANYPSEPFTFGRYTVTPYDSAYWHEAWQRNGLAVVAGNRYQFRSTEGDEAAARTAADIIRHGVAADAARRAEGATFVLHFADGIYYAAPKGKDEIHVKTWKTRTEASEGMKNTEELRELWDKIRETPALRRATNRPRVGADYRHGESITPEAFAAAFPFRGVEFGNWLTQADRVIRLNETFDALHDLCRLCGLTADAATLKSWLAMAFGSRGIPNAAAHYESAYRVINLTKEHGGGSLAHEWFHALDNFTAARFDGYAGQFAVKDWGRLPKGELREAARALYTALVKSPFACRSEDLDYIKGKDYYARTEELAARAFECYVIELAKIQGWTLDFLANVTTREEWMAAVGNIKRYPYPTPEETAELAPLFARFLSLAADAAELSEEAADLFAEGRAAMQQQREQQTVLKAQAAEEKRKLRQEATDARLAEKETQAAAVCAECGATWHITWAQGSQAMAVGGGAGFLFLLSPSGRTQYCVLQRNPRLKKSGRTRHQYILELRPDVADLREWAYKDLNNGSHISASSILSDVYYYTKVMSWTDFSTQYAAELSEAARLFAPAPATSEKAAETPSKTARTSDSKADTRKAEKHAAKGKNEGKPEPDLNTAPSDRLQLIEISDGLAVVPATAGDWKATLYNRRQIKAHGCTWNKEAQQWQATTPEAIEQLRAWFNIPAAPAASPSEAPAPCYSTSENSPSAELWQFSTVNRWAKPFIQNITEAAALEYLDKVTDRTDGRYMEDGVQLQVIKTNPFWHVLFNPTSNVYTMVFVLRHGESAVIQAETLRHLLLQARDAHIREAVKASIERIQPAQLLALSAEGSEVTVEHDPQNTGKFRVTWFSGSRIDDRYSDCTLEQAAELPALFLDRYNGYCGNIVSISYRQLQRAAASR